MRGWEGVVGRAGRWRRNRGLSDFWARAEECPEMLDRRWALGSKLKRRRLYS